MGTVMIRAHRETKDGDLPNARIPAATRRSVTHRRKFSVALCATQGLLALVFLFAGA